MAGDYAAKSCCIAPRPILRVANSQEEHLSSETNQYVCCGTCDAFISFVDKETDTILGQNNSMPTTAKSNTSVTPMIQPGSNPVEAPSYIDWSVHTAKVSVSLPNSSPKGNENECLAAVDSAALQMAIRHQAHIPGPSPPQKLDQDQKFCRITKTAQNWATFHETNPAMWTSIPKSLGHFPRQQGALSPRQTPVNHTVGLYEKTFGDRRRDSDASKSIVRCACGFPARLRAIPVNQMEKGKAWVCDDASCGFFILSRDEWLEIERQNRTTH